LIIVVTISLTLDRGKKFKLKSKNRPYFQRIGFFLLPLPQILQRTGTPKERNMRNINNQHREKGTWIVLVVFLVALTGGSCTLTTEHSSEEANAVTTMDSIPLLVTQVRKCAKLYTAEYKVHKIVTHDDVVRLKGSLLQRTFNIALPLGDRKIAIPIDAKLKAWIDFSQFNEENIERDGDRITIVLPDPQVTMTSSKIDQKGVKQYVSIARANFSDKEMSAYEQKGRASIIQSIPDMGIIETARANAAKVIVPMMKEMGYREDQITVAFRKQFGPQDIQKLLKLED